MLDGFMRQFIDPPLNRMGRGLAKAGVNASGVTLVGLGLGLGAACAIAYQNFWLGFVFIALSRIADGLDGGVARATQKTDFGGYFDIVADFFFYGAIPLGFAFANPDQNGLAAGILLLSFHVNGSTFLAFAILAERQKLTSKKSGEKSLYFSDGLIEGTETIGLFFLITIWPSQFVIMALIFSALTFYTGFARTWRAYKIYSRSPSS